MSILEIVTYPNQLLRKPTRPVKKFDAPLQHLIQDMIETMYQAPGVGLAAIQVGVGKSVFVYDAAPQDSGERGAAQVVINPKIVSSEGEILSPEEGCLSVPDFRSDVKRAAFVVVEGLDRDGNPIRIQAEDFPAIVLQHEIDHLNGRLFIDHISPLKRELFKRRIKKKMKSS